MVTTKACAGFQLGMYGSQTQHFNRLAMESVNVVNKILAFTNDQN